MKKETRLDLFRYGIISPLITESKLGVTKFCEEASKKKYYYGGKEYKFSKETLKKWYYKYQNKGFDKTKDTTLDTHMMKNNEWGAVAYLTQSIYGRCSSSTSCTEIGINNWNSHITGNGWTAGSSSSTVAGGAYNTIQGMDASTTGNIYGIEW